MDVQIRVVIADDDEDFLDTAHRWLARRGAKVRSCGDAEACLELFSCETPDVAVIDGKLPGNDGLWLIQQLRRSSPDVPLIMISGNVDPAFAAAVYEAGVLRFLLKPCRLSDVEAAVCEVVQQGLTGI
jgi:DNA-binding NtrC family response regulator